MLTLKAIIDFLVSAALFVNALLFIPQAIKIFKEKTTKGVSLITFAGFLLIQLAVTLYAITEHDFILIIGYLLSMITCGAVVILTLVYRKSDKTFNAADLSLEEIIKQLPGHVYWKGKNGIFVGSNTNNWRDFGLNSLSEYQGKTDYDWFSKEYADKIRALDDEVVRTGKTKIAEEWCSNHGEPPALYLSHKTPLKNSKGEIVGIIGTSLEITHAKQKLIDRLEMLENIISVMPGNVYWLDENGVYLGCNDNHAQVAGLNSCKEIVGKAHTDISSDQKVMHSGRIERVEEFVTLPNGKQVTFLSHKVPLKNAAGKMVGMVNISLDITDRKQAEQELKTAKNKAEAANKVKIEFLYNMRHDFRTPFSGILGMTELMAMQETDPEKKENLNDIAKSAKTLLDQLNEVLGFCQLENGELPPILAKQFDLKQLIQNIIDAIKPATKNKNIELKLYLDPHLPQHVIGDAFRTQHILINLISNAVKFTTNGYVKLETEISKKENHEVVIKFKIEDTGIGIPDDKQDLIFEKFTRLNSSYNSMLGGKGYGLRIVKRFLEDLHGELHLKSALNEGTTFIILIPCKLPLLNCSESKL